MLMGHAEWGLGDAPGVLQALPMLQVPLVMDIITLFGVPLSYPNQLLHGGVPRGVVVDPPQLGGN